MSDVAVEGLADLPGEELLDACSQGSITTRLSSLLLTSNGSDMPVNGNVGLEIG